MKLSERILLANVSILPLFPVFFSCLRRSVADRLIGLENDDLLAFLCYGFNALRFFFFHDPVRA